MKKTILITALTGTTLFLQAALPTSVKVAERRHAENVTKITRKAEKDIKSSKEILIGKLKAELSRQVKRNSINNIVVLKVKIDNLTKKEPEFQVEGVSPDSAIDLQDGKRPWSNRNYIFVNLPKSLAGMKYYQYEARSGKGVKLRINKTCVVKIIVGGYDGDLPALKKWKKEGWRKQSRTKIKYTDHQKNDLFILTKSVNKDEILEIKDYSEYAGIIVITN